MYMKICTHTYNNIISVENLLCAWREFERGKSKKVDVMEYKRHLMTNILNLHTELREKRYVHGSYKHFVICDPKRRDIHKASVRDRLVHHAVYRILYPYFDKTFISDSCSCRDNKGTHRAIRQFEVYTRKVSKNYTKQCYILKCDIRKFFASIDHNILTKILEERIKDQEILGLFKNIIHSFETGLPLGNLTSQLLVNIYMNEFDQYVKHVLKEKYYIRYADDFVFVHRDKEYLQWMCEKSGAFLTQRLKLTLHPNKVFITTIYAGIDFLGFVHFPQHRVLRTATKRRMLRNVSEKNMSSYLGLLGHGSGYILKEEIRTSIAGGLILIQIYCIIAKL